MRASERVHQFIFLFVVTVVLVILGLVFPGTSIAVKDETEPARSDDHIRSPIANLPQGRSHLKHDIATINRITTKREANSVDLIGHTGGQARAVALQDNFAYVGEGPRLTILDVTKPASPVVVSKMDPLPDIVYDVVVDGSYAYIAAAFGGLRVIDISNAAKPIEIGFIKTPTRAYGVSIAGDFAYVADFSDGLRIISITDPKNPTEVGFLDYGWATYDVTIHGQYALVSCLHNGLRIVDISNPNKPSEVGFYKTTDGARSAKAKGNLAYVADGLGGLRILDLSDPAKPGEVGHHDVGGNTRAVDVVLSGNHAFVVEGWPGDVGGLRIVNIADAKKPVETGFYNIHGSAAAVAISGAYAYVSAHYDGGLRAVDISQLSSPSEKGSYNAVGYATDVAVNGHTAYIASDWGKDLRIVSIEDPAKPELAGTFDSPDGAHSVDAAGNYAYITSGTEGGFRVVDVSDPKKPAELSYLDIEHDANGIKLYGDYAYIARGGIGSGLRIIDVKNPAKPTETGFVISPGYALDVDVAGNYAYLAAGSGGLRVIDVQNPSDPFEVGFFNTPNYASGISVFATYAYVADGHGGLRILNVANPSNPQEVGSYPTRGSANDVVVNGKFAYVAVGASIGEGALEVVDISNPAQPKEFGFFDTVSSAKAAAIAQDNTLIADVIGGLYVLHHDGQGQEVIHLDRPLIDPIYKEDAANSYVVWWTEVVNAAEYELQQQFNWGNWGTIYSGKEHSLYVENRPFGRYCYLVRALGPNDSKSEWSNEVCTVAGKVEPFLDLPFDYGNDDGSVAIFRQRVQSAKDDGGQIYSWFDHNLPNYSKNSTLWSYDSIYTGSELDKYYYDGHDGYDFVPNATLDITDILAAADGTVVETQPFFCYPKDWSCGGGHGNYVILAHKKEGYFTSYSHLSSVKVSKDDFVHQGDTLGVIGWTGKVSEERAFHLHFAVYLDSADSPGWDGRADEKVNIVDPFGWWREEPDPWVLAGGPFSHYLWIHDIREFNEDKTAAGTTLTDTSGDVKVFIPAEFLARNLSATIFPATVNRIKLNLRSTGNTFAVRLVQDAQQAPGRGIVDDLIQKEMADPIDISIDYSDSDIGHVNENDLTIYLRKEGEETWTPLETTVLAKEHAAKAQSSDFGTFSLQGPLLCPADTTEPDDFMAVGSELELGVSYKRWFDSSQDEDWFMLDAGKGQVYQIRTDKLRSGVDTVLEVYDGLGNLLAANNDGGAGLWSRVDFQAPRDDLFYVRVLPNKGSRVGCDAKYILEMQVSSVQEFELFMPTVLNRTR